MRRNVVLCRFEGEQALDLAWNRQRIEANSRRICRIPGPRRCRRPLEFASGRIPPVRRLLHGFLVCVRGDISGQKAQAGRQGIRQYEPHRAFQSDDETEDIPIGEENVVLFQEG